MEAQVRDPRITGIEAKWPARHCPTGPRRLSAADIEYQVVAFSVTACSYHYVFASFSSRLVAITHSASRNNYRCEVVFDGRDARYVGDINGGPHAD